MSQLMVPPGASDLACVDELVSISMHQKTMVVRPTRTLDALGTQVLNDVVNAATSAGSTVMLHRPGALGASTVGIDVPTANGVGSDAPVMVEFGGIGLLIVRSESAVWTIDCGSNRLVRSDRPVDRLALSGPDWTAFEALWISPHLVRALTVNGLYVTGRRASRHPCPQKVRARPVPLLLTHIA